MSLDHAMLRRKQRPRVSRSAGHRALRHALHVHICVRFDADAYHLVCICAGVTPSYEWPREASVVNMELSAQERKGLETRIASVRLMALG